MSSLREQALAALYAQISGSITATVRRADGTAVAIPPRDALVTMEDGSLDSSPIFSPLQYEIEHDVPITVEAASAAKDALDAALLGIANAVAADPTLGGLVDWAEVSSPDTDTEAPVALGDQKLPPRRVANLTVTLSYVAPTPAG